jgi:hypothetical protein
MDSRAEGPGPVRAAHRTQLPEETAIGRTQGTQAQAQVLHVLYCSVLHSPVLYPYCAVLWRNVLYRHANLLYCTVLNCALLESTAYKCTLFLPQISSNHFCVSSLSNALQNFSAESVRCRIPAGGYRAVLPIQVRARQGDRAFAYTAFVCVCMSLFVCE